MPSPPPSPMVHEDYRIALYYLYVELPDPAAHVAFQLDLAGKNQLTGRVRVAPEGLNGVLSGRLADLQVYEKGLVQELVHLSSNLPAEPLHQVDRASNMLDMKFCSLRPELTVQDQLFPTLVVKQTKTVIGLVEQQPRPTKRTSRRRKARRRAQHVTNGGASEKNSANDDALEEGCASSSDLSVQKIYQRVMEQIRREHVMPSPLSSLPSSSLPVPHLSPREWDALINQASCGPNNNVVLLDCRNVYESNVGHFCAPSQGNAVTMLTNTRKFSELPQVMVEQADQLVKSTHIFAYCTGGVRCETATVFLKELLREKYPSRPVPEIYQLKGGIQRYLEQESYSSSSRTENGDKHNYETEEETRQCSLYRGKNFVFDPRRVDPMNSHNSVVGRCLVCHKPHDDYDNGHAPSLECASRCWNCRVLILVCNECRSAVSCWGDKEEPGRTSLPKMYCGGPEQPCWHRPAVRLVTHSPSLSL